LDLFFFSFFFGYGFLFKNKVFFYLGFWWVCYLFLVLVRDPFFFSTPFLF